MGSSVTYYRRYLYQLMLDIVEQDEIDADSKLDKPSLLGKESKAPATPAKRAELKSGVSSTSPDAMLIEKLEDALKILATMGEYDDFITEVNETKQNLTKSELEEILISVGEIVGGN